MGKEVMKLFGFAGISEHLWPAKPELGLCVSVAWKSCLICNLLIYNAKVNCILLYLGSV